MDTITFESKSLLRISLDLTEYPELTSKKKFIRKGISILRQYTPGVLRYLSRQQVLSNLDKFKIRIITDENRNPRRVRQVFKLWIQKEKSKRILCLVFEALIIPLTGILALLPGPNFFFYVPALLFYYHLTSFLGLRRIDVDHLDIDIHAFET
jgi:hypothetical protein